MGSSGESSSSPVVRLLAQWREFRKAHPDVPLSDFLKPEQAHSRLAYVEVICVDLMSRLRAGAVVQVEDYLQQFPQLADSPEAILELVDAELCVRSETGQPPARQEYHLRFPQLAADLRKMFDFHQLESQIGQLDSRVSNLKPNIEDPPDGFRLLSEIRHDETGTVFRAIDLDQGRKVALKFLRSGLPHQIDARQLNGAIECWKTVKHPCLLKIYSGRFDQLDRLYYAFELSEGISLCELLQQPLTVERAIRYLAAIVGVMVTAEQQGMVAARIDPRLIQIDHQNNVRVQDPCLFSIVAVNSGIRHDNAATEETHPRSHENLNNSQHQMILTGTLLMKMLLGDPSWNPDDPAGSCGELQKRLLRCEHVDQNLVNLISNSGVGSVRCEPAYTTLEELVDDLIRIQNGQRVAARRTASSSGKWTWWRKH